MTIRHHSQFTASDGTSVPSLTPTVGAALLRSGGYDVVVTSNRARSTGVAADEEELYTQDTFPNADYSVFANVVWTSASAWVYITARKVDNSNSYRLYIDDTGTWYLYKIVSSTPSIFATGTLTITTGVTMALELRPRGTSIRGFIDSTELGAGYTDGTFTAANVASVNLRLNSVAGSSTTGWHVDFLRVEDDVSGGSAARGTLVNGSPLLSLTSSRLAGGL